MQRQSSLRGRYCTRFDDDMIEGACLSGVTISQFWISSAHRIFFRVSRLEEDLLKVEYDRPDYEEHGYEEGQPVLSRPFMPSRLSAYWRFFGACGQGSDCRGAVDSDKVIFPRIFRRRNTLAR